jgi:hypothetical protein
MSVGTNILIEVSKPLDKLDDSSSVVSNVETMKEMGKKPGDRYTPLDELES